MNQAWRELYEAKQFLDGIFNSPLSGWRWPGYLAVEQIMIRLGLHRQSVYKLIHKDLIPRGAVYRRGRGTRGRAGRFLVRREAFEAYAKQRQPRRNRLVSSTRWTRSGPRPVLTKPEPPVPVSHK